MTNTNTAATETATPAVPAAPSGPVWDALTATPAGSVAAIAEAAGMTRDEVRATLSGYAADGWATITPGKGRNGNLYTAVIPAPTDAPADTAPPTADTDGPAAATGDGAAPADGDTPPSPSGTPDENENEDEAPVIPPVTPPTAEDIAKILEAMAAENDRRAKAEADLAAKIAAERERSEKIEAELRAAGQTERTRQTLMDLTAAAMAAINGLGGDETALSVMIDRVLTAADEVREATGKTPPPPAPVVSARPVRTGGTGGGIGGQKAASRNVKAECHAHMAKYPNTAFSAGDLKKATGLPSPGAVSNAMPRMIELGMAVMVTESPMTIKFAGTAPAAPAPAPAAEAAPQADAVPAPVPAPAVATGGDAPAAEVAA